MKKILLLLCFSLILSACGQVNEDVAESEIETQELVDNSGDNENSQETEDLTEEETQGPSEEELALIEYDIAMSKLKEVVKNGNNNKLMDENYSNAYNVVNTQYSLIELNGDESYPELVLKQMWNSGDSFSVIYEYNKETDTAKVYDEEVFKAASISEENKIYLSEIGNSYGLLSTEDASSSEYSMRKITINDGVLNIENENNQELIDNSKTIDWSPVQVMYKFDEARKSRFPDVESLEEDLTIYIDNEYTFYGTVRKVLPSEFIHNTSYPGVEGFRDDIPYYILELDQEIEVYGKSLFGEEDGFFVTDHLNLGFDLPWESEGFEQFFNVEDYIPYADQKVAIINGTLVMPDNIQIPTIVPYIIGGKPYGPNPVVVIED